MNLDDFALLIHIIAALGYAAGTLLSMVGLLALRRTQTVEQARSILTYMNLPGPISGVSFVLIVASGLFLTLTVWGWQTAWIDVTLGSLLILLLPTGALMGIRRQKILDQANQTPDGPQPASLARHIHDPWMASATVLLNAQLLGIVSLMVFKPGLGSASAWMAGWIITGLVMCMPFFFQENRLNQLVDNH